jgi:hypothetical protein
MEKYKFYIDKKITVWVREFHQIEAASLEDATKKMTQSFHEDVCDSSDTFVEQETLYETMEYITTDENLGIATAELYDESMNIIADNEKN